MRATVVGGFGIYCMLAPLIWASPPERFEFTSKHMGTEFTLTLYAPDRAAADAAQKAAFDRITQIEHALSDYDPNSEVMRVCKQNDAAPGQPIRVGPDLFQCLEDALHIAEATDGAFDPTVGPLSKLWRITRRTQQAATPEELAAARAKVGFRQLTLDPVARTVTFTAPGVRLDFGGIGKGFAADQVLKRLRVEHQLTQVLVAAGGDVTAGDAPPGEPGWTVDIRPLSAGQPPRRLVLGNAAVSTSGDLDQVAVVNGVRYSHVLDPKTGLGLTGRRSVTVIAPTGTQADAFTKAASVWPADRARSFLDKQPGAALFMAVRDPDDAPVVETTSARFSEFLAK